MKLVQAIQLFIIFQCLNFLHASSVYKNLADQIFKDYDPALRPVRNKNHATNVTLRFGLIKFLNMDAKAQTIELLGFVELAWMDELLKWNPSDYDDITRFRYPHDKIWKPDIIMTNTPDLNNGPVMNSASTNVMITSDGTVTNAFTVVFKAICRHLSMVDFPFDSHKCYLEFGSWTFNVSEVDIFERTYEYELPEGIQEVPNSEWLVSMESSEKVSGWECCPNETYAYLRIRLNLQRKPLYYIINLIVPTIIVCYVAFLGMFCPTHSTGDRADKAFICLCTLFTISMLMLNMSAQMPVTSDSVPLICYFLGFYMVILAIAVVFTCISMHVHLKGLNGRPVPQWARKFFLQRMGKLLLVDEPETPDYKSIDLKFRKNKKHTENETNRNQQQQELSCLLEEKFRPMNDLISNLCETQRKEEYERKIRDEWAQLSIVLDRFFLIFFISLSTIVSILLFC